MTFPTALRLFACAVLLALLPVNNAQNNSDDCGQMTFSGPSGNITSPNYPNNYKNRQLCDYVIVAPSLSKINFTFNALDLEQIQYCVYDWIEFTCESNSIKRPIRYCGSGNRAELTFKPCSRVLMRFITDGSRTGSGFLVSYDIEPIRCQGNCIPVASGAGYNCTCDSNQTQYIPPPFNQCPDSSCSDASTYCACSLPPTTITPSKSTTTNTSTALHSDCGQGIFTDPNGNITSPNYPNIYEMNQVCNYVIVSPSLSTINFTFNALDLEQSSRCSFDWIEFTCLSNSISRPVRYCGSGYRAELSFKPCSGVLMRFITDVSGTGSGFSVSYDIEPIRCQGNCTPVANGAGYNCTCDANQTQYIPPPYNQCPDGCLDFSTYCACRLPPTNITTSSGTTTNTSPPTTTGCGQSIFNDPTGNIASPNYPNNYNNSQVCNYVIVAPSLSTINFTFNALDLEQSPICTYDWIEFTCQSNIISRPVRYCGYGNRPELSFKPCSRVLVRFFSDVSVTGIGFLVSYAIEPISCQGNCAPVANGAGYNCTCDANQTPFIPAPYDQCPTGCFNSSKYCACALPLTTTTISPPNTTALHSGCGQSIFNDSIGAITSPNYPNNYEMNQVCTYSIVAPSLSTINFTFNALDLEHTSTCYYDWIEFTCESNSISRPVRYCGSGYRAELSFKPCSRVLVRFVSDGSVTGSGFSVSYDIEPITCQGDCAPVANGSGYNCPCGANQTPFIPPPHNQCPVSCSDASKYCVCNLPTTTTTTRSGGL